MKSIAAVLGIAQLSVSPLFIVAAEILSAIQIESQLGALGPAP